MRKEYLSQIRMSDGDANAALFEYYTRQSRREKYLVLAAIFAFIGGVLWLFGSGTLAQLIRYLTEFFRSL